MQIYILQKKKKYLTAKLQNENTHTNKRQYKKKRRTKIAFFQLKGRWANLYRENQFFFCYHFMH